MKVLYVSPVRFGDFKQRSHRFVDWLQENKDADVLWVNPYPARAPRLGDVKNFLSERSRNYRVSDGKVEVLDLPQLPLEFLGKPGYLMQRIIWRKAVKRILSWSKSEKILIVAGRPSNFSTYLFQKFPGNRLLFDCMDFFPAFYKGRSRTAMETNFYYALRNSEHVIFSSHNLQKDFAKFCKSHELVLNATAFNSKEMSMPQLRIENLIPKFVYAGTVGYWFDWQILGALAEACPEAEIHIIGPIFTKLPEDLSSNFVFTGPVSEAELTSLLPKFDLGLIPFIPNELTHYVDPIKFYDYQAAGLGIISTQFGEIPFHAESAKNLYQISNFSSSLQLQATISQAMQSKNSYSCEVFMWVERFNSSSKLANFRSPEA